MASTSSSRREGFGSPAIFPGWPLVLELRPRGYPTRDVVRRLLRAGGKNPFGEPMFKAAWGGPPRHIHLSNQWLLLRWFSPIAFGTSADWYATRWEGGEPQWSFAEEFQEDYPSRGDYEVEFAFPEGVPFNIAFAEHRIRKFLQRRELPPLTQRRRNDLSAIEAEEQRGWQEDYERFSDATPAFAGEAMVGYGQKSAAPGGQETHLPPPRVLRKIDRMTATRAARLERQLDAV